MNRLINREKALNYFSQSDEIVSAATVSEQIARIATEIKTAIGDEFPLVLPVMGGATVFTGMLLPMLDFPLDFDYVHLTRYQKSFEGREIEWRVLPAESVAERTVLVLDDILDEGNTMKAICDRLKELGAEHVYSAVLCNKKLVDQIDGNEMIRSKPISADFVGFNVPNRYVFGCGMDVEGYWRNLPSIRALKD